MTQFFNMKKEYWREHYADALPAGYRRVEYIESTGEQWIDTGVVASNIPLCIKADFAFTAFSNAGSFIIGAANNSTDATTLGVYSGRFRLWLQGAAAYYGTQDANRHVCVLNASNGTTFDGSSVSGLSSTQVNITCPLSFWLFRRNGMDGDMGKAKLYSAEMLVGTAIRSFVPCVRIFDNKPGMYDLCGSTCPLTNSPFYVNSGTGADFGWKELSQPISAQSYVQDGLVALFDGIENTGFGEHNPSATTWKNLADSEYDFENLYTLDYWTNDSIVVKKRTGSNPGENWMLSNVLTLEVVGKSEATSYFAFSLDGASCHRMFSILPTNNRGFQFSSDAPSMYADWTLKRWSVAATWDSTSASSQSRQFYNGVYAPSNSGTSRWEVARNAAYFGHKDGTYPYVGELCCIRAYSRALTDAEIARNYSIDKARFNLT